MAKRFPPLNALKAFESAARHLSFTKAADELFVTQAAISHQIKTLETFLTTKLFHRKNRSLLLTDEGQFYFQEMREIFSSIQDATDRLLSAGNKGKITVATPPSFASQWLVPKMYEFSLLHPEIDVRLKAVDLDSGFLDDSVDVAVYYGKGNWDNLATTKLIQENLTPMCSPLLLEKNMPLNTLSDLKHYTLLHDNSRSYWKQWLSKWLVKDIAANHGPIFSHTMMVLQAAIVGQGVALADTVLAKTDIDNGRLICPFEERTEGKNSYYLVCNESQYEKEKIMVFRNWMLHQVCSENA